MGDDVADFLGETALFASFEPAARARLAGRMTPRYLQAGTMVMAEGEPATSLYLVTSGRLRAYVTGRDGVERPVGDVGVGEIVGEMSLLSAAPRTATVRAVRDTRLLELSGESFTELVLEHPSLLLEVTRTLVDRLERSIHGRQVGGGVRAIAIVPAGNVSVHRDLAMSLATALSSHGRVTTVDRAAIEERFGAGSADAAPNEVPARAVTEWLHNMESSVDYLLFVADGKDSHWTGRCLRSADRILLVGRARSSPEHSAAEILIDHAESDHLRTHVDLVLMHPAGARLATGTRAWMATRCLRRIHHLRDDDDAGLARLARVLAGRSVALVLSGGGARGFAHIGVLRALREAGVPIDHVGGASFGGSVAATIGMGWDIERIAAAQAEVTVEQGSLIDFTVPAVALSRGAKLSRGIRKAYGDTDIEDLWTEFFCVSSDLTAGRLRIHDSGPVWRAVRASVAIPGTFPPVRAEDGHVLVDGGVMNNLPIDVMERYATDGPVLAVDLRAGIDLPSADLGDGITSGWRVFGRRLNPWAASMQVPRMLDILLRTTEVASGDRERRADVMFRPPVEEFGILAFKDYRRIIDAGYRHAVAVLEEANLDR